MPRKCSVCTHPKRAHINRALMNPKRSLRQIAAQYGVSSSTLQRHKKHMVQTIQLAKKNGAIEEGKTALEQFNEMITEAEKRYREAEGQLQIGWFREWRAMLELAFKLGIEEERRRDTEEFRDVTPGVLAIIKKEFEE